MKERTEVIDLATAHVLDVERDYLDRLREEYEGFDDPQRREAVLELINNELKRTDPNEHRV